MPKKRKPVTDSYKRGYTNGVLAAVDALLDDLDEHGQLAGIAEYDEDGLALRCKGCLLAAAHFPRLSDRWNFVMGISHEPGTTEPAP